MLKAKSLEKVIANKMKNKKGQALIEFVLIIPIILLALLAIIDFSMVFYNKNHLEGVLNGSITYVLNGKTSSEIKELIDDEDIKLSITFEEKIVKVKLTKEVDLISPFFKSNFNIETERAVIYE